MSESSPPEKPKLDRSKLQNLINRVQTGEIPVVSPKTEDEIKKTDTLTTDAITDAEAGASAIEAEATPPPQDPS